MTASILVVGVGNSLLGDEGVGIHAIRELDRRFRFPDNVTLRDGGTAGLFLVSEILQATKVLVLDALRAGNPPGTVMRLDGAVLAADLQGKISPHELGLRDILSAARFQGSRAEAVVLGIEPERLELDLELSATLAAAVPRAIEAALDELRRWGVHARERERDQERTSCTSSR